MFDCSHKSQYIGGQKEKFVRLDDLDSTLSMSSDKSGMNRRGFNLGVPFAGSGRKNILKSLRFGMNIGSRGLLRFGESLRSAAAKAVIPKDLKVSDKKIFDPQDRSLLLWNRLFVLSCIISVSIDPVFFYLLFFEKDNHCVSMEPKLGSAFTTLRTAFDLFYLIHMIFQFHTAYIAPSSRVFGRGELVVDPAMIARRYLRHHFIVDFLSVLPVPQLMVWSFLSGGYVDVLSLKDAMQVNMLLQFFPRFFRVFPLISELKKIAGVFAESTLAGAAYYLFWYMFCSHIIGAAWYVFTVEDYIFCWKEICSETEPPTSGACEILLDCGSTGYQVFDDWKRANKEIFDDKCNPNSLNSEFNFGIYLQAIESEIHTSKNFFSKFFYCFWFGLQNLSTLGQGLKTTTSPKEVIFSIAVGVAGLVLLALLIGNMQTYLTSLTVRLEEMRIKRRDSEQWMHHRWLPQDLRERVRRYEHFKWLETRGVDEESLVQSLPKDLRRDIKRHLCLNLVRRVPLFANMDERLLDAICERLKPSLCTEGTCVVREGDPVDEMLLIIRGRLESVTTDGGRTGFYNRGLLKEGDFCGEELLTWALDPKSSTNLPLSTRTVRALAEVEAFALKAEELKFVAGQFRRLHSRQVQHTFRFYSQQWRTWAACFIQATWRRRSIRKKQAEQRLKEVRERSDYREVGNGSLVDQRDVDFGDAPSRLRATVMASRFAANALRGHRRRASVPTSPPRRFLNLQKPSEPDFNTDN
ncbi:putative cyclic nucleotide-gated ion channel 8 [Citrus sinensis]|uniref:Cyclic nucleotide-gated ion channel 8 n=2 Tax=Citrus sinensis TaxID=2711 RepID=A0ACB8JDW3_CITSI|nr:putative cyclic nucleotide-gated ion channel 8 [Citrus sinensis]